MALAMSRPFRTTCGAYTNKHSSKQDVVRQACHTESLNLICDVSDSTAVLQLPLAVMLNMLSRRERVKSSSQHSLLSAALLHYCSSQS
jgi:hypothetical protein